MKKEVFMTEMKWPIRWRPTPRGGATKMSMVLFSGDERFIRGCFTSVFSDDHIL